MWNNDIPSIVFTRMKIFTKDKLEVRYPNKYTNTNFTKQTASQTTAKLPTVSFQKLQGSETGSDLEGETINAIISNFQIDVITNTSQTDADNIADVVMESMKSMRYQVVGDLISDNSDRNTYRVVARYRRIIGYNDIL